jgi:hypothetical protein
MAKMPIGIEAIVNTRIEVRRSIKKGVLFPLYII